MKFWEVQIFQILKKMSLLRERIDYGMVRTGDATGPEGGNGSARQLRLKRHQEPEFFQSPDLCCRVNASTVVGFPLPSCFPTFLPVHTLANYSLEVIKSGF